MQNFNLVQKTNVIFGVGQEYNVGKLVKNYTSKNCLLVHNNGAYLKKLVEKVKNNIAEENIEIFELTDIKANPVVSKANEGIQICKDNNIEFILAIGGGSVMDTVKFISFATYYDGDPLMLDINNNVTSKTIPHGTIVTLSGTSSECSNCSMMIDDLNIPIIKYALTNSCLYFDFAIINPELTYTLPMKQMSSGIMDTISHALEVYLAQIEEEPLIEGYMETVIRTALNYGLKAIIEPRNYKVRSTLSICAMLAYRDDISNGGVPQDWGCHAIENPITTTYNGIHGQTLGIITPAFLRVVYVYNPRPFITLANRVFDVVIENKDNYTIVDECAKKLENWLEKMNLPTRFNEIGITIDMLESLIEQICPAGIVYQLKNEDVIKIFKLCV